MGRRCYAGGWSEDFFAYNPPRPAFVCRRPSIERRRMGMRETGIENGKKTWAAVKENFLPDMAREVRELRELFPTVGDMDALDAVATYDRERLACEPDYAKFPELRGLIDRHVGERIGFKEASGLGDEETAFHFSWGFFVWRRINAHHLARYDLFAPQRQCTNVFFPESAEGGVVISDNRDDTLRPSYYEKIPQHRIGPIPKNHTISWVQGGVSSSVLLDDEPVCTFPCRPHELMPEECKNNIRDIVAFMDRYKEFWGAGNQLWVDKHLNGAMIEKSNTRMGVRYPTVAGAICTTACAYITPEMGAFKRSRLKKAIAMMGDTEATSPDWNYNAGCEARNHRLLALTNAEAARGATLWGALNIVSDVAVPFPDRICLAGERTFPEREPEANWSMTQHAIVMTGENRRALYRSMQDLEHPKSVVEYTPKLTLGEGVEMKDQWQADVDAGRCVWVE